MNYFNNNKMHLEGKIASELEFSHELFEEKFYTFNIEVARLSDKADVITITASEKLLEEIDFSIGLKVLIKGQLRSYNKFSNGRNKLILTAFARSISKLEEKSLDPNQIILEGYICKNPVFRTTPFGREISDLLIAVNRAYNKSDYIPIIAWGRNARFAKNFKIGEKIRITGRFQSREYQKIINESEKVTLTAYEVSVSSLNRVTDEINEELNKESNDTFNLDYAMDRTSNI